MGSWRLPTVLLCVITLVTGWGTQLSVANSATDSKQEVSAGTSGAARSAFAEHRKKARPKPGGHCRKRQIGNIVKTARYGKLQCSKNQTWKRWHPAKPNKPKPIKPVPYSPDEVLKLDSGRSAYWAYVPNSYDDTHKTAIPLFVWLHGCGGESRWDIYTVSPGGSQSYISIAVGGREGGCWNMSKDPASVKAAIADVKSHFRINPHRVVIGGYSSGGNLAYKTAFYNAKLFAGVLATNTAPFWGTGSTKSQSIAAAAWKFHIVHVAHTGDDTYEIDDVRHEINALDNAGFPAKLIELPGNHWDDDTDDSGTDYDINKYLLPYMKAHWRSP